MKTNIKSENGMTFIVTTVLVIVIAALVFAIVYYARIEYAKNELETLKTDILLVQAKVKLLSSEYTLNKKEEVLKGVKIEEKKEDSSIKSFLEAVNIKVDEKGKKYYVLDKTTLEELELGNVKLEEGSYYVVEYTSNEVYYTKGVTYSDGNTYYKISDIKNLETENVK